MNKKTLALIQNILADPNTPDELLEQVESYLREVATGIERSERASERQAHDSLKWQAGFQPTNLVGFQCESCKLICDQSLLVPVQTNPQRPDTEYIKLLCVDCASPKLPRYVLQTGVVIPQADHKPVGQYSNRKPNSKPHSPQSSFATKQAEYAKQAEYSNLT